MSDPNDLSLLDSIRQARDELKLQIHLASMDSQEEYKRLNDRLNQLEATLKPKAADVIDTIDETGSAVMADLRSGYAMLKESVKGSEK